MAKDAVKTWQAEAHEFKAFKGSFIDTEEAKLIKSTFEERETKKADRKLRPIRGITSNKKLYNAKEILNKVKQAKA